MSSGRPLDRRSLEAIRLDAVARIEVGERVTDVARELGFDRAVVNRWVLKARKQGVDALRATVAPGRAPKLDDAQVMLVRAMLLEVPPEFWGFPSLPWTRTRVAGLIRHLFDERLSAESAGRILRCRMGLPPPVPARRLGSPSNRRATAGDRSYLGALRRAEAGGATVHLVDGLRIGTEADAELLCAISPRGQLRWRSLSGPVTAPRFASFVRALCESCPTPSIVIAHDRSVHRGAAVARLVSDRRDRLTLERIPHAPAEAGSEPRIWSTLGGHTPGRSSFRLAERMGRRGGPGTGRDAPIATTDHSACDASVDDPI